VCNLYPFTSTIAQPNCTLADAVEEIDIGGVTLLRAAAKNHARVSVLSNPADYERFIAAWTEGKAAGDAGQALRSELALKAFEMTAQYDAAIGDYFRAQYASADLPADKLAGVVQRMPLRYGANPHQKPAQAFVEDGALPFTGASAHTDPCFFVFAHLRHSLVGGKCLLDPRGTSISSTRSTPTRSSRSSRRRSGFPQRHPSSTFPQPAPRSASNSARSRSKSTAWMISRRR
jgi:hypothetical protein